MILLDPELEPDRARTMTVARRRIATGSNTRSKAKIDPIPSGRTLTRFLREAQAAVRLRGKVSVLLTSDAGIRRLNRQFRGKDKATDVLSFPAGGPAAKEVAGDLAVSVPTARRQGVAHGHSLRTEIKILILHGLLHLAGYDHETDNGRMARQELRLRAQLGLPQGLIERVGERA